MVANRLLFVDLVKMVSAQVFVRHFVTQDEVGRFQHAVGNDYRRVLPAPAAGEAPILLTQIGVLGAVNIISL